MLDDDALGIPGRPRGIDDVADPVGWRPDLAVREGRARLGIDGLLGSVEQDLTHRKRGEPRTEAGRRHDSLDVRVGQDEADALPREAGVERHIGGIDLHHRQQRDIGLDRFVEQKTDAIAGFDPLLDQVAGDLVGAPVEVAIGDDGVPGVDCVVLRETQASLLQEMMQPLALLPTKGAVRAGQDRWPNACSFEAFAGHAEARWRSHVSQRARLDPESHCITLDAVDPRTRKSAPRPQTVTGRGSKRWVEFACEVPFGVGALFRERTFFTLLLWESVDERKLNEKTAAAPGKPNTGINLRDAPRDFRPHVDKSIPGMDRCGSSSLRP